MAINQGNRPINPFTGSVGTAPPSVNPVEKPPGGVNPNQNQNMGFGGRCGGNNMGLGGGGVKRRGRRGGMGASGPRKGPLAPPSQGMQPAQMPQEALPSHSDPFNLDWALARRMGNGGYQNGGY